MKLQLVARCKAAARAFRNYQRPLAIVFEEDIFVAAIKKKITQYFPPVTQNELLLHDFCETALKELKSSGAKTTLEAASGLEHHLIGLIIQKYCLVAGVAATWELETKFLAAKLNVDVYDDTNPGEHIQTRSIRRLVKGIQEKCPRIDIGLSDCAEIRNGLAHGNLQQLKVTVSKLLKPSDLKELDPKMAVLTLTPPSEVRMANETFTKKEAIELGPFFWFLSGGNSRLLDHASDILHQGLLDMRVLISVAGLSFDETAGYFDQLAVDGKPWSLEQRNTFAEKRGKFLHVKPEKLAEEIDHIHSLFNLNSQNR